MNYRLFVAIGLGAVALGWILATRDLTGIASAFLTLGWHGAVNLVAWRMIPVGMCVLALWVILPRRSPATLRASIQSRLTRDAVAALLPVIPVGSELVGARVLALAGIATADAVAVQVVDLTFELIAQVGFSLTGVLAWMHTVRGAKVEWWGGLAITLPLLMIVGLGLMQDPKILQGLVTTARRLTRHAVSAAALGEAIQTIYSARDRVAACGALHFAGWFVGIGEAWFALKWMGHPLPLVGVLVLEAVIFAVKSAAFAVPWSAGIQEGAYLALGAALGIPAEAAVTLALIKRFPDLALGVPSLFFWHRAERRAGRNQALHSFPRDPCEALEYIN